jgi:hypothetical protein
LLSLSTQALVHDRGEGSRGKNAPLGREGQTTEIKPEKKKVVLQQRKGGTREEEERPEPNYLKEN